MSRCRIITWSLLLAVAALVALAWLSFREPRAGGESLSYWLKLGANPAGTGDDAPSIPQSEAAIREIGPKAIPTLLAKLRTTDSPWKQKTYQLLNKQNFHSFEFVWPHQENAEGIYGFAVLGSNALPALPALEICSGTRTLPGRRARRSGISAWCLCLSCAQASRTPIESFAGRHFTAARPAIWP